MGRLPSRPTTELREATSLFTVMFRVKFYGYVMISVMLGSGLRVLKMACNIFLSSDYVNFPSASISINLL